MIFFTLPETNVFAPENRPKPNRKVVFQPSICRGYASFREGNFSHIYMIELKMAGRIFPTTVNDEQMSWAIYNDLSRGHPKW